MISSAVKAWNWSGAPTRRRLISILVIWSTITVFAFGESIKPEHFRKTLLEIVSARFPEMSDAEIELCRAIMEQRATKFHPPITPLGDSPNTISSEIIEWICRDPTTTALVPLSGFHIKNARIEGDLDLRLAKLPFALVFDDCAFSAGLVLDYAEIAALSLLNLNLSEEFRARGLIVRGNVSITAGSIGAVSLPNARIGGDFSIKESVLHAGLQLRAGAEPRVSHARALNLRNAKINGDLLIGPESVFFGIVDMEAVEVSGNLVASAAFQRPPALAEASQRERSSDLAAPALSDALSLDRAVVKGSVRFKKFHCEGAFSATAAQVGSLELASGSINAPGAVAIHAQGLAATGAVALSNTTIQGAVDLSQAQIGGKFRVSGITIQNVQEWHAALSAQHLDAKGGIVFTSFKAVNDDTLVANKIEGGIDISYAQIEGLLLIEGGSVLGHGSQSRTQGPAFIGLSLRCAYLEIRESALFRGTFDLRGSRITGDLRLFDVTILDQCIAEGLFRLESAKVDGALLLLRSKIQGKLDATGIVVGQSVDLGATAITASSEWHYRGGKEDHVVLVINGARIHGDLRLDARQTGTNKLTPFKATGEVRMIAAEIGNDLVLSGSIFSNPAGTALVAENTRIGRSFSAGDCAEFHGEIALSGITIRDTFAWPSDLILENVTLDLRGANIGTLLPPNSSWSRLRDYHLRGLVFGVGQYENETIEARFEWLNRQPTFYPQLYEQLADAYKKSGRGRDAVAALTEKKRREAESKHGGVFARSGRLAWRYIFGPLINFGYAPGQAVWAALLFIAIGAFVFHWGFNAKLIVPPTKDPYMGGYKAEPGNVIVPDYPLFDPIVYSANVFIPLVDFGLRGSWMPSAARGNTVEFASMTIRTGTLLRLYYWFHIASGWALTTLAVAGFTGVIPK